MIAATRHAPLTVYARRGAGWAIILAVFITAIMLGKSHLAERLNGLWFDSRTALLRTWVPKTLPDDVKLVAFDDATLSEWPEPLALWHFHFAELFRAIRDAKPKLVIVDIALPSKSMDKYQAGGDIALARAMGRYRRCRHSVFRSLLAVRRNGGDGYVSRTRIPVQRGV